MITIAALIGCLIAIAEVLSHYPRSRFFYLLSLPFFSYILLNAGLASLTYQVAPYISNHSLITQNMITRAVIAGLGYAAILRIKILNLRVGNRNVPIGTAFLYETLNSYFMKNIDNNITLKKWKDAASVAERYSSLESYVLAVNIFWMNKKNKNPYAKEEQAQLKSLRDDLIKLTNNQPQTNSVDDRVITAAYLLIEHLGNKKRTLTFLDIFNIKAKN